jgi:hypothetical protein
MELLTLYKKTHRVTGLQYLGYTSKDPYTYLGSGHYWTRHLVKHGNEIDTEILLQTFSNEEIKEMGKYYSNLWNVVESKEWANLKEETGTGGAMSLEGRKKVSQKMIGRPKSKEWRENHSKIMTGKQHSAEAKINHSNAMSGEKNGMWGRTHTDETKKKLADIPKTYLKGKTYEEIYGPEKAAELKKIRTEHFKALAKKRKNHGA